MPDNDTGVQDREFLIVGFPEDTTIGTTLRLLGVAGSQDEAERAIRELDPGTLGRVGMLERKAVYVRRAVVESVLETGSIVRRGER